MITLPKILAILSIILLLLFFNPLFLLCSWVVGSPFVTNYIDRPLQNPLFGSYKLIDFWDRVPGFDILSVFTFDRAVLLFLLIMAIFTYDTKKIKFGKIDAAFLALWGAMGITSFFSLNPFHGFRVAVDTFGLCYIAYLLGRIMLTEDGRFNKYLNALLFSGLILIVVSLYEYYLYGHIFLYRITGPFRYWENLGLTMAIIFIVTLFKKNTSISTNKASKIFYNFLLIFLSICIFLTQTRTIMFGLMLALFLISIKGKEIINRQAVKKYYALGTVLIIILTLFPALLTSTSFYQHRLSSRTDAGRIETYIVALRMFAQSPVLGIGIKNFGDQKLKYVTPEELKDENFRITERSMCHNSYLVTAAEMGLLGLIPLILIAIFSYQSCRECYYQAQNRTDKYFALSIWGLTVMYFATAMTFDFFFEYTIDNKLYYMLLGIAVGKCEQSKCIS